MHLKQCNFEVTDKCNFKCSFCLKSFRSSLVGNIKYEYLDKILKLNPEAYIITGGEPSLNKDAIFYFIKRTDKYIILNTNLSNFNTDELQELSKKVIFHIDFPSILRNQYIKITNTSPKIFRKVKNNLEFLSNLDCKKQIVIVVNEENKDDIYYTVKNLSSIYNFNDFMISCALTKNVKDQVSIFKKLDNFAKYNRTLNISTMCYTREFKDSQCKYIKETHRCSAGIDRFVVKANGEVVNCAWNSEVQIGHITEDLQTILKRGRLSFKNNKFCLGC